MKNVIEELLERGFIDAITSEELISLANSPLKVYCGFDPTADSLHLGSLVAIMGLAWFQRYGHTPVIIVGGATGMIGDPSGKSMERPLLDKEAIKANLQGITDNLKQVLDFNASNSPLVLNNYDWFKEFSFVDFLREIGKFFRVGTMLAKDSVKTRLQSEEGMSFTELCYQLLQGYDFYYLNQKYGVSLQLGGSDQWGNITAGIELTRKKSGKQVYGATFPLLTRSDGQKFGKSEKGAIWLSPDKLSPYEFYQYLYRVSDDDVIQLLKLLTFVTIEEIQTLEKALKNNELPANTLQKKLAEEVTKIVHGEEGLAFALKATQAVAPGTSSSLDPSSLEAIAGQVPVFELALDAILGKKIIDVFVNVGLSNSKGEVRRLIRNGGLSINNERVANEDIAFAHEHLIDGRFILLALGKKSMVLLRVTNV